MVFNKAQQDLEKKVLEEAKTHFNDSQRSIERLFDVDLSDVSIGSFSECREYVRKIYDREKQKELAKMNFLDRFFFKFFDTSAQDEIDNIRKYNGLILDNNVIYINEKHFARINDEKLREYFLMSTVVHEAMHIVHKKIYSSIVQKNENVSPDEINVESLSSAIIQKTFSEGFATYFSLKIMLHAYELFSNFERAIAKQEKNTVAKMQTFIGILYGDNKFYNFLAGTYAGLLNPKQDIEARCYSAGFRLFNELDSKLGLDGIKKALRNPPTSILHINYPHTYVEYLRGRRET